MRFLVKNTHIFRHLTNVKSKSHARLLSNKNIIPVAEVTRFGIDCMSAVNVPVKHGTMLSDVLVAADYRGHYSHGLNRLGIKMNVDLYV